ncbi:MAG: hypothetical protein PWR31_163 [Bacillota bacterium]|nr:hypothetical protein [Bacillota bacterium]
MADFLVPGSSGREVKVLQACLNFLLGARLATDGCYGVRTEKVVRRFQLQHGLAGTGSCDVDTWLALAQELSPNERHLLVLLQWSLLLVKEGDRILWAQPLKRPVAAISPGVCHLESVPRARKGARLLKFSNHTAIRLESVGRQGRARHLQLAGQALGEDFLGLLKPRMPVIIHSLRRVPSCAAFPPAVDPAQAASRTGVSLRRFRHTAAAAAGEIVLPLSRPCWPAFWAWPAGQPEEWLKWLPWFQGVVLAPELGPSWVRALRRNRLPALVLTQGQRGGLAARWQGWCYAPADHAALTALNFYNSRRSRIKHLTQILVLPETAAAASIPVLGLNLDYYAVPAAGNDTDGLSDLRFYLSPERLLLVTPGAQAMLAARLARAEELAGLVFTSPPADTEWLQVWVDYRK